MSPNPKDVIVLSDDEENIIDAARRASDQDKKMSETLNDSIMIVSPPGSRVPPPGRPRLETPEAEVVAPEPIARPFGRPPLDTPEKLNKKKTPEKEKISPINGSGSGIKRPYDDIEIIMETTAAKSKEAEEDILFVKIVNKNKANTNNNKKTNAKSISSKYNKYRTLKVKQEPKSPELSQNAEAEFSNEPQPNTSQLLSMAPRHTAQNNKDLSHRRSGQVEKILTVNRTRLSAHENEVLISQNNREVSVKFRSPNNDHLDKVTQFERSPQPSTSGLQSNSAIREALANQSLSGEHQPIVGPGRAPRTELVAPQQGTRDESPERQILGIECQFDLLNISYGTPVHNVEDDWPWSESETPPKSPKLSAPRSPDHQVSRPVLRQLEPKALPMSKEAKVKPITNREKSADFFAYSKLIQYCRASGWINDDYNRDILLKKLQKLDKNVLRNIKLRYEKAWNKKITRPETLDKSIRKLVMKDISRGLEPVPIPVCTFTNHTAKPKFEYITRNEMVAPLADEKHPYWTICCSCTDGCGEDCECVKASLMAGTQIADKYLLTTSYSDFFNTFVVACGPDCSCRAKCTNSVDNVMKADNFEMFCRNEKMGYGVRANRPIEANTLLCEFVGEKITQAEHKLRVTKTNSLTSSYSYVSYYAQTDELEDYYYRIMKTICPRANMGTYYHGNIYVDPSRKGNLGRFFGHSEYPNISMIRVVTNDARLEATRLFVYTTQPIRKHDEIFLDYGQHFDLPTGCLCDHICCGDAGKHILMQSKKKAQAIFDKLNEDRTAEIQEFIDEEQKRQMLDPAEFHLTWRKVQMMRTRGKQYFVLKLKKKPAAKKNNRRRKNNGDTKQEEDKENKPTTSRNI